MVIAVTTALGQIIVINKFCIFGSLKVSDKACIGIEADITLFGANFKFDRKLTHSHFVANVFVLSLFPS